MSDVAEIAAFVRARLDEDAAVAQAIGEPRTWLARAGRPNAFGTPYPQSVITEGNVLLVCETFSEGETYMADAEHIARWSNRRVLDEVGAKRRLVNELLLWEHAVDADDETYSCRLLRDGSTCTCDLDEHRMMILRALAAPHNRHPGFKRAEWTL